MSRISIILSFVFLGLLSWFALEGFETRAYVALIPFLFAMQITLNDLLELYVVGRLRKNLFNLVIAPGTIAHELSHLIVAMLTGCEVKKVSLFSPEPGKGTLGCVEYSPPRDEFEFVRNSAIALAPFFGCGILLILMLNLSSSMTGGGLLDLAAIKPLDAVLDVGEGFFGQFAYLDEKPFLLLLIYLQLCLGLGSAPSSQDFRVSSGLLRRSWVSILAVLLVAISLVVVGEYAHGVGDYGGMLSEFVRAGLRFSVIVLSISILFLLLSIPFMILIIRFSEIGTNEKLVSLVIALLALMLTESVLLSAGAFLTFLFLFRYKWMFLRPR